MPGGRKSSRKSSSNRSRSRSRSRTRGSAWRGDEEDPAPPTKPLDWRRGVGQAIELSFSAGAIALRRKLGLNTETNVADTTNAVAMSTTLTLIDNGPTIPIGATAGTGQRIGREIRAVRFQHRGYVYTPATSTGIGLARIIAVYNRQQDGSAFTSAQVLATNTNLVSMSTADLTERGGTIVYDKVMKLLSTNAGNAQNDNVINSYSFEFEVPDWHMSWPVADTAGLPTTNLGGALQVYAMYTGIATTAPQVSFYSRLEYVDN